MPVHILAFRVGRRIIRGGAGPGRGAGLTGSSTPARAPGTALEAGGRNGTTELRGSTQGCEWAATIARKAAAAALGHYVSGYFGTEHGAMVDLASATPLSAGPGFAAFSNDEAFARRLLDAATVGMLAQQRAQELARLRGNSGFGLLLAPAGVIVGTQYALPTAADLAPLVAFGAEMSERLKMLRSA